MSDAQIRAAMGQSGITTSAVANQNWVRISVQVAEQGCRQWWRRNWCRRSIFDPAQYSADPNDYMGEGSLAQESSEPGALDLLMLRFAAPAGAGVTIGQGAADALGVMAGKTFYTGADGKRRPDHVALSYRGQAGTEYSSSPSAKRCIQLCAEQGVRLQHRIRSRREE